MWKGVFVSYRRGKRTQRNAQILMTIEGIHNRKDAARFIGRQVVWNNPGGKSLRGTISGVHGRRGVVQVRFKKGLPGYAVGAELRIH